MNSIIILTIILIIIFAVNNKIYEKFDDVDDNDEDLLKKLNIVVSHTEIKIINNNEKVLYSVVDDFILYIPNINFTRNFNVIANTQDFIMPYYNSNNIIIILKRVGRLPPKVFMDTIQMFGGMTTIIRENENYILITNKNKTIYFELVSTEPIYYPYMVINKASCIMNPNNIYPPKQYNMFNKYDVIESCGHETDLTNFAITQTQCIPMNSSQYIDMNRMPRLDECINGYGTNVSVMSYDVDKIYNFKNIEDGRFVTFYSMKNGKGNRIFFRQGEYDAKDFNRSPIESLYVPKDYYLFLLLENDVIPYYGPILIDVDVFNNRYYKRVVGMVIQKYNEGSIVICGNYNNREICMVFGKGMTIINPKLYITIKYIKLANVKDSVKLFSDIYGVDLIEEFVGGMSNVGVYLGVKYPRVVRSVKVG